MPSYVSPELTHFVGAGEPTDDDRFLLLLRILREGRLLDGRSLRRAKKRPVTWFDETAPDGTVERHTYFAEPYFDTNLRKELESNDFVRPDMVCFCDIPYDPPDFFRVHTAKYNRFGVAFSRGFLVLRGACPVFYVARSAATSMRLPGDGGRHNDFYLDETYPSVLGGGKTRGRVFTDMASRILELIDTVGTGTQKQLDQYKPGETNRQAQKLNLYRALDLPVTLFAYLFGYMKFFDPSLPESHPDNFYMEREWRVLGEISFDLSDVARVLLPPAYATRLRSEIPQYSGPILELTGEPAG